jgi:hypothetical protein
VLVESRCDSKDVVDIEEVECRRISNDWWRAVRMGLEALLAKKVGSGVVVDELEDVEEVLWEMRSLYLVLFAYYASCGPDVSFLYLNEWSRFVDDFGLANNKSKNLRKSDLDRIFIAVDTKAALTRAEMDKAEAAAPRKRPSVAPSTPAGVLSPSPSSPNVRRQSFSPIPFISSAPHSGAADSFTRPLPLKASSRGLASVGGAISPAPSERRHGGSPTPSERKRGASPAPSEKQRRGASPTPSYSRRSPTPTSGPFSEHATLPPPFSPPTSPSGRKARGTHDDLKKNALTRVEFLVALVHVAILR